MEKPSQQSCNPILTLGGRVGQGTTLTVLAVAAVGAGLLFGWDSLVALGLSTAIVSLLPCLAMCALGVCAARLGRKDSGAGTPVQAAPPKEIEPVAPAASANAEATEEEKVKVPASAG